MKADKEDLTDRTMKKANEYMDRHPERVGKFIDQGLRKAGFIK